VDTSGIDPAKIIYRPEVFEQLEVNLWAPMRTPRRCVTRGSAEARCAARRAERTGKTLPGFVRRRSRRSTAGRSSWSGRATTRSVR